METRLTQVAIVIVFGLIIVLGTVLLFQGWYNSVAPTQAEVQALANRATKMDTDVELTALNSDYQTASNIDWIGRILVVIECVAVAFMLIYTLWRPIPERPEHRDEDAKMQRAYESS